MTTSPQMPLGHHAKQRIPIIVMCSVLLLNICNGAMVPVAIFSSNNVTCSPWTAAIDEGDLTNIGIPTTCSNTPQCITTSGGTASARASINSTGWYSTRYQSTDCTGTASATVTPTCTSSNGQGQTFKCLDTATLPLYLTAYADAQCTQKTVREYFASVDIFTTYNGKGGSPTLKTGVNCQNFTGNSHYLQYAMLSTDLSTALAGKPNGATSMNPGLTVTMVASITLLSLILTNFRN